MSKGRDNRIDRSPGLTRVIAHPGTGPAATTGFRQRRVFAGEASELAHVREWLTTLLPPGDKRDDVISIATELGSNAIKHTASGQGGWFAVQLICNQIAVRVAVVDGGSQAEPHVTDDVNAEHGRGLLLVHGLAARTGVSGDHLGRIVWADVAWQGAELPGEVPANGRSPDSGVRGPGRSHVHR